MNRINHVAPRFLMIRNFKNWPWSDQTEFLLNMNRINYIQLNTKDSMPHFLVDTDFDRYFQWRKEYDSDESFYKTYTNLKKNLNIVELSSKFY